MTVLRIAGGAVYDPANGFDGEVRDVCIADGRVVGEVPPDATTIDARGMVVMPGGVDIHAHVASSSVNVGRRLLPEDHDRDPVRAPRLDEGVARSGTGGTLPTSFSTGYRYAGLGYTTVFDAAVAPLHARASHAEFDDTPIVDGGFFVLLGNDEYLIRQIDAGERERAREYAAWMLGAAGAYAIKIVNPGGIERWKRGDRDRTELDTPIGSSRVTPRAILETLVDAANALRLPHAAHIHCNNLGIPGNVATTMESMRATAGRRAHFTHLQFHSYAAESGKTGGWRSGARELIEYINAHPETSCDVGQVLFGPATTLTADGPVEYMLYKSTGRKWVNVDIELETGCGVVPYTYEEKSAVSALQWVIGLELFLLSADPWRVVLSTDHPNGGSFAAYPELIRLLMDRTYRDDQLKRVNHKFLAGSALADGLAREYTLNEIAIVTRAGPARLLGLRRKGHLGVGADADVTVYPTDADRSRMFATPRYVVKGGTLVVEEGQLRRAPAGRRLHVRPPFDTSMARDLRLYFDQYATVSFDNYPIGVLADAPQPL
jgi:formylmethanofuran dehydrogenase subunit A